MELIGKNAVPVTENGNIILEPTCGRIKDLDKSDPFLVPVRKSVKVDKEFDLLFSLVGKWTHGYFHWIFDYLFLFEGLEWYKNRTGSRPLILIPPELTRWQEQLLSLLDVPMSECVPWTNQRVKVKTLIVTANRRYEESWPDDIISRRAIKWFASKLQAKAKNVKPSVSLSLRVFITRKKANVRRILNEAALLELTKPLGFKTYVLEELSILDQVNLFAGAEVVIGPHGAGFSNLIFAKNAKVIELYNSLHVHPDYYHLSKTVGLEYGYIIGDNQPGTPKDYIIPLDEFKSLLQKMNII